MKLNFYIAKHFINKHFVLFEHLLSLVQKYYCITIHVTYTLLSSFALFMTILQNIYLFALSYS